MKTTSSCFSLGGKNLLLIQQTSAQWMKSNFTSEEITFLTFLLADEAHDRKNCWALSIEKHKIKNVQCSCLLSISKSNAFKQTNCMAVSICYSSGSFTCTNLVGILVHILTPLIHACVRRWIAKKNCTIKTSGVCYLCDSVFG